MSLLLLHIFIYRFLEGEMSKSTNKTMSMALNKTYLPPRALVYPSELAVALVLRLREKATTSSNIL